MIGELIELIRDRWEWDSAWREQIVLSVILGAISLMFVAIELAGRRHFTPGDS